jgi:sulfur carrier protein ThiS
MAVEIRVYGGLVRYSPSGKDRFELDIQNPVTIRELLEIVGIPESEVWMVTVNGVHSRTGQIVKDNDQIMIFEPVLGG